MKTIAKLLLVALCAGLVFTSCKKEVDGFPKKEPKFSKLTPEEHKENLESSAITLINETEGLMDVKAAKAADNMMEISDGELKKEFSRNIFIQMLASVNNGNNGLHLDKALKNQKGEIQDNFDSIAGIYTWNASIEDFDYQASNDFVVRFPYSSASTSNDCEMTMTLQTVTVTSDVVGIDELPSNVTCTLEIQGKVEASYELTAKYDEKGLPTEFKSTLKIDSYKWQYSFGKSNSNISMDFLYAHGSKTLVNYGGEIGGNLNFDDVEAYMQSVEEMEEYEAGTLTEGGTYLQNVKMYFQVCDIKLVETANTKDLMKALDPIVVKSNNGEYGEGGEVDAVVPVLNSHVNLYLMYVEDFRKIADAEFFVDQVETSEWEMVYNQYTGEYDYMEVTKTEKQPSVQFIFKDGSKSSVDAYFEEGFDNLDKEMEDMMTQFENTFGSPTY